MALIEAAFAATRHSPPPLSPPRLFQTRSIRSITVLSKRRLADSGEDIEDAGRRFRRKGVRESLLHRFRRKRGISVTDITGTEWCEKQMEFILLVGRPEATKAMKAGSVRHALLEEEVIKRVKVQVRTVEDAWALKLINFIVGVNQLLSEGLTRELPLIGYVEGAWMVGVVDELRIPLIESEKHPILVDTKTRVKATVPSEPQKRNGRLQLMCYKYLWDSLVSDSFPSIRFFDFFSLNRNSILSQDIRETATKLGFSAETLQDVMRYFRDSCQKLLPAHEQLILRYELQQDHSLLSEDKFGYDLSWVKAQIKSNLDFWKGEREAQYTSEEERWKCKYCHFASSCLINRKSGNDNKQPEQGS